MRAEWARWRVVAVGALLLAMMMSSVDAMRGARPEFESRLAGATEYSCVPRGFAGSGQLLADGTSRPEKAFPIRALNDDYCDCEDGSDEPGTAACANGEFHCKNKGGLQTKTIPSSFVNDGVCDCCDGSDEWSSAVDCPDQCVLLAKEQRLRAKEDAMVIREGLALKSAMLTAGKKIIKKSSTDLDDLEKEKAEAQRTALWKKALETRMVALEKRTNQLIDEELPPALTPEPDASPGVQPPFDDIEEKEVHLDLPATSDILCSALQPRSRFTGWITNLVKEFIGHPLIDKTRGLSNRGKKEMARRCLADSRSKRAAAESSVKSIQRRLEDAAKKAATSHGGQVALMASHGQCTRKKFAQYEFEICLFEQVKQFENNRMIASLGNYESIDPDSLTMKYANGAKCYQGPARSATVFLLCGTQEDIVQVDEPEKCAYELRVTTPAACRQEELERLLKLASHDEL